MGPTFSTILKEFWTEFLQFWGKEEGGVTPTLMCAPVPNAIVLTILFKCKNNIVPQFEAW